MTLEPSTLLDILRYRATREEAQRAYTFLTDGESQEDSVTYGELDRRARAVGAWLQSSGAVGERVLLLLPPGLEYIAAFFGCLYAGAVAVPAYPPRLNETWHRLRSIAGDAQAVFGITTSTILSRLDSVTATEQDLGALRWLAMDRLEMGACAEWMAPDVCRDTLALIQYTSGSTAEPKGVMVSQGNLLDNSAIIHERFGHNPSSRGVIWLPPYHDMGLIGGIVQPLYGGFPVTLMSPVAFLMRPVRWLQAISRTRATTSGGPNFAYDLCVRKITPEQRATLDLSCWEVAFNGAEPVRQDTLDQFASAFEPYGFRREAFYPCYGLAEATLFVTGGPKRSSPVVCKIQPTALQRHQVIAANGEEEAREIVACGEPPPNLGVAIVDPERLTRCAPNQVGEIWVSGSSVALGYWNRPEETDTTFRACIADTGEGPFLRTGDLGFLLDGQLVVAGRLKDLIILAGRNHYPQDIERTAEQAHPVLQPGGCAAFSVDLDGEEKLMLLVEVDKRKVKGGPLDSDELVRSIRRAIAEHHDIHVHEIFLLKPGSIPKTTSGKIQRNGCRSWFLNTGMAAQKTIHEAEVTSYD